MFQVIKIRKLLFFIFLFFILFSSFNICFSYELSNDYGDCNFDSIIGTDTDDVYFDSNVLDDGDGSQELKLDRSVRISES